MSYRKNRPNLFISEDDYDLTIEFRGELGEIYRKYPDVLADLIREKIGEAIGEVFVSDSNLSEDKGKLERISDEPMSKSLN